jgi:hypothetical protein
MAAPYNTGCNSPVSYYHNISDKLTPCACGRNTNVPKRDLVSTIQVLLQTKRLKIPTLLPEAHILLEEMTNFQVKISLAGHDSYGAWRGGTHDDLLLAVALACWAAEKKALPKGLRWPRVSTGRRAIYAQRSYQLSHLHELLNGRNSGFLATWIGEND